MTVQRPNWLLRFINPKNGMLDSHAMATLQQMVTQANTSATDVATLQSQVVFSKSYTSSGQTITSAGALTLAHSLGLIPKLIQARLVCGTGEGGYNASDELVVNPSINEISGGNSRGLSIVPDTTNLNIRFGANANAFQILRKDTGALFSATNGNWTIVFRAWA